jgi:3-hydroxybutyryl-CoA dehydrogenase
MRIEAIKTIAVIGAGTMGQGIAQVCASSGFKVFIYDTQSDIITKCINAIRKNLDGLVEKGKVTAEEKDFTLSNINLVSDFRQLQIDLAIEAVVEKLDVKQKIFAELEKLNGKDAIFVSNTSSIQITQIAAVLKHPQRFAGLHFFNPAPLMKLVEVIRGAATDNDTVTTMLQFCEKLKKQAITVQDSPGFVVNRVARHFYVESLKILEENVADFQTIDALLKSAGFKMGPFELMDLIGVDTNFAVTKSMYDAFHQDAKFRPSRIQQQKVDAGHHGRKTGKGFYEY